MGLIKNKYELGKIEIAFIIIILLAILIVGWFAWRLTDKQTSINSFAECVAAGNPVMESYPEQCAADGKTFTNPDQQALVQPTEPERIPLAELPAGLQTVVKEARSQSCAGDLSVAEGALDADTTANRGAFIDGMFAQVNLACGDSGSNGLFAYRDNAWVFVAATQYKFLCSDLVSHTIPVTYIAECVETNDSEPVANPVAS